MNTNFAMKLDWKPVAQDDSFEGDEADVELKGQPKFHWSSSSEDRRTKRLFWLLTALIVSVTAVTFAVALTSRSSASFGWQTQQCEDKSDVLLQVDLSSRCGTSTSEAVAAGCTFDIFAFGWYPSECVDMQLYNESIAALEKRTGGKAAIFVDSAPVADFLPKSLTGVLSPHQSRHNHPGSGASKTLATGSWDHRLVACIYAWQKVQRAALRRWPLDEWSSDLTYARECRPDLMLMWKLEPPKDKTFPLKEWYPKCGLSRDDLQRNVKAAKDSL